MSTINLKYIPMTPYLEKIGLQINYQYLLNQATVVQQVTQATLPQGLLSSPRPLSDIDLQKVPIRAPESFMTSVMSVIPNPSIQSHFNPAASVQISEEEAKNRSLCLEISQDPAYYRCIPPEYHKAGLYPLGWKEETYIICPNSNGFIFYFASKDRNLSSIPDVVVGKMKVMQGKLFSYLINAGEQRIYSFNTYQEFKNFYKLSIPCLDLNLPENRSIYSEIINDPAYYFMLPQQYEEINFEEYGWTSGHYLILNGNSGFTLHFMRARENSLPKFMTRNLIIRNGMLCFYGLTSSKEKGIHVFLKGCDTYQDFKSYYNLSTPFVELKLAENGFGRFERDEDGRNAYRLLPFDQKPPASVEQRPVPKRPQDGQDLVRLFRFEKRRPFSVEQNPVLPPPEPPHESNKKQKIHYKP